MPAGGLDPQQAGARVREAYGVPVELHYGEAVLLLDPAQAGFEPDIDGMLAEAGRAARPRSSWSGFWDYLMGRARPPVSAPLQASFSPERLRQILMDEIAARYDRPPIPVLPYPGTVAFTPGVEGVALEIEQAMPLIEAALRSPSARVVELPLRPVPPSGPTLENLETLLEQTLRLSGFDGTAGLYLYDLKDGGELNFAYRAGERLPVPPEVAFTGASLIKIPIMISVFRRMETEPDPETRRLLAAMIEESGNEAADWVMERAIDPVRGPLEVSEDMQALGLENTFLAGYFKPGAPLLALYETPANRRVDTGVDPDIYNQTTPAEIGSLLMDIYTCSQSGGSRLEQVFPGQFNQAECQAMRGILAGNKTPVLIEAGVPEIVDVIHKHGWVSLDGVINTIGDAAIVASPEGDYILVVYLYHPEQLLWDPASALVSKLSRAVYNYFEVRSPHSRS